LGHAKAVSDGSFKEKFGTAAWVFYHAIMNATLGSGKLITPGYPEDKCAYRSELSGLYGIVATIQEHFKIWQEVLFSSLATGRVHYIDAPNRGTATLLQNISTPSRPQEQRYKTYCWHGHGSTSEDTRMTNMRCS